MPEFGVDRRSMVLQVGVFGGYFTQVYDPTLVGICCERKRVFLVVELNLISKGAVILPSLSRDVNPLCPWSQLRSLNLHSNKLLSFYFRKDFLVFQLLRRCGPFESLSGLIRNIERVL